MKSKKKMGSRYNDSVNYSRQMRLDKYLSKPIIKINGRNRKSRLFTSKTKDEIIRANVDNNKEINEISESNSYSLKNKMD